MARGGKRPGKRRGGPWYGEFRERLVFERGARQAFLSLRTKFGRGAGGYSHTVDVEVPGYEPRQLRISFDRGHLETPRVFSDGPTESKHRFSDGSLCMWYPPDPLEQRWVREDGLLELIGHAIQHLFREAWWRETGHWLGAEAPHRPPGPKPPPPSEDKDDRGGE
jgi:hypothetical protein